MKKKELTRLEKIYKQSILKAPYTKWSFIHRFWVFQAERIPLIALSVIIAFLIVTIAKSNNNVNWFFITIATTITVLYFMQIRLSDEPKDYEHDSKYYPDRPVQRGVITLKELAQLKTAVVIGCFVLSALTGSFEVFLLACLQQTFAFLTRKEFYIRDWLRKHFLTYQFSHYIQLFILDWFILTVLQIQPLGEKLLYFVFVILMIGIIEASRTIGGIDGLKAKDRYTHRLGVTKALVSFVIFSLAASSYTLYLIERSQVNSNWLLISITLFLTWGAVIKYKQNPKEKQAKLLHGAAFLTYLSCVATLFFK